MKDRVFGVLQRVGRSFMLPIAILPVAGLLLGIGGSFTNETMLRTYRLYNILGPGTVFNAILQVMSEAGNIVFANLPIIFALGVAIGMAKREKEVAALAAAIAFFIMHASISALITINGGEESMLEGAVTSVCGITSLQMGVFGGIIVGLGVASLHNRFYRIQLPQVLSFFGGTRFVPIISALVYTGVGILMFFIWPVVQNWIYAVGDVVLNSGYAGTWVYGLMERLLIPFGLHHVFYLPFWQTAVGGTLEVAGQTIEGAQNIFFAQLADPTVERFAVSATRFMSGKFPLMIFGLPGAALAMYKTALPEKRKAAGGLLLSAAMTSMLTGITEPLEFTFLFVAPVLYVIHCAFAGLAYMLMHVFRVGVGMTFSGGLIDMFLFGILQGNAKTNWIWIVVVGIGYFIVYYFLFSFLIRRFDFKTPGRDETDEVKLYRRGDMEARKQGDPAGKKRSAGSEDGEGELSRLICRGLGGKANISDVDCCATRLRCTVEKSELVDDALLKSTGASGVVHKGNGVQIIYGPRVTVIKSDLEAYLEDAPEEDERELQDEAAWDEERDWDEAAWDEDERNRDEAAWDEERELRGEAAWDEERELRDESTGDREQPGRRAIRKKQKRMSEDREKRQAVKRQPENASRIRVRTVTISSPLSGRAEDLSRVPDEAFAQGMMGGGAAITPEDPMVRAPEDGMVSFIFETKHALGFQTDTGIDMLIHLGIDTVKLEGQGFQTFVRNGQRVKKGDALIRMDLDYLKENAPSLASPVLCPELSDGQQVRLISKGEVAFGDPLLAVDYFE